MEPSAAALPTTSNVSLEQQLDQLANRNFTSPKPLISEIKDTLRRHLSIQAIPNNKPKPTSKDERAVEIVILVFRVIQSCGNHLKSGAALVSCFTEAWPAIWKWLQFLDSCGQSVKYKNEIKRKALCAVPDTLLTIARSRPLRSLVMSTPGVITMITRHWMDEGRDPVVEAAQAVPCPFTLILSTLLGKGDVLSDNGIPDLIASDLIASTPGGANAIALTAIEHLDAVLTETPNFDTIHHNIALIATLSSSTAPMLTALLNQGMIPAIVKMLMWLERQPLAEPELVQCVVMCHLALIDAMKAVNGHSWAAQAFDAGILLALLKSGPRMMQLDDVCYNLCIMLLSNYLVQYLVYKSTLRSVSKALRGLEHLKIDKSAMGHKMWEIWVVFKTLALERMAIKNKNDQMPEDALQRGCHRSPCTVGSDRDSLLRCSGCFSAFYCGKACQKIHWPVHKPSCQEYQRRLRGGIAAPISLGDSTFLAEIALAEVHKNSEHLLNLFQALPTAVSPSELAISMNYLKVPFEMNLVPISGLVSVNRTEWDIMVGQVSRSAGKEMLMRVKVQRGNLGEIFAYIISTPLMLGQA